MRVRVNHNLKRMLTELEIKDRRKYQVSYISKETGIATTSIYGMLNDTTRRVSLHVIEAMIKFFRQHGAELGVEDLLLLSVEEA